MNKISVYIVDADKHWSNKVKYFLENQQDIWVCGMAFTKESVLSQVNTIKIDIILIDFMLSENHREGIEVAFEINKSAGCPIIFLTSVFNDEAIVDAFVAGAVNYMDKSNLKDLPEAIRAAYLEKSPIHSNSANLVRASLKRMVLEKRHSLLTATEKKILEHMHEGRRRSQIAEKEYISENTLKKHINKILTKLDVKTSKEAVRVARLKGILN